MLSPNGTTLTQIRRTKTPSKATYASVGGPAATAWRTGRNWKPIEHAALVDAVRSNVGGVGLRIASADWHLCRKGLGLIGVIEVKGLRPIREIKAGGAARRYLLIRHSNDGAWALAGFPGIEMGTDRVPFIGSELLSGRRHTSAEALKRGVAGIVSRFVDEETQAHLEAEISALQGRPLESGAEAVLLAMQADDVIPMRFVPLAAAAWRKRKGKTAWDLHAAIAATANEGWSPLRQFEILRAAREHLLVEQAAR